MSHIEYEVRVLEIDKEKATSLDVQSVYEQVYGIDLEKNPNLSFDENLKKVK